MNVEALSTSLAVKGNDMMAVIYLASLIRSVLALHRLIDNKEQRMWSVSHKHTGASIAQSGWPLCDRVAHHYLVCLCCWRCYPWLEESTGAHHGKAGRTYTSRVMSATNSGWGGGDYVLAPSWSADHLSARSSTHTLCCALRFLHLCLFVLQEKERADKAKAAADKAKAKEKEKADSKDGEGKDAAAAKDKDTPMSNGNA